ncbi:MAG TPA: 1-deoxy-D-xylulose-5-phosphate synthase, partial [Patescibacteria group bacterium]|nr:1-deoxy-D-xylulose-5-phosphate synthase [Patescibacteria group bacterium]
QLGFKYFGPIDGHNIPLIMSTLHHAKEIEGPVLIHVITKKGKGYKPAEENPTRFHGTGPFDIETGLPLSDAEKQTYTSVFGKSMAKIGEKDDKVVAITAAMIDGTGLEEFATAFPGRFFDVGIAEELAVTSAGAMAKSGYKPVVAVYSTFLQRAYDEIIHDVCLQNLPVIFAIDRAGIVGEDGATHNGVFDIAFLRNLPNMVVMAPKNENELQQMLYTATKAFQACAIRYPRGSGPQCEIEAELNEIEIGKGEIVFDSNLKSPNSKLCIISLGSMVQPSIDASKMLEKDKIAATVINARFVTPIDKDLILKGIKNADKIITVEEGVLDGGFGSAVLELLSEAKINTPIKRFGLPCKFIEHGKRDFILSKYGLDAEGIYNKIIKDEN